MRFLSSISCVAYIAPLAGAFHVAPGASLRGQPLRMVSSEDSVSRGGLIRDAGAVAAAAVATAMGGTVAQATAMPVVVIGASGKLGKECVAAARRRGLPIRAVVRDPSTASPFGSGVELIAGDVTKPETLERAVAGAGGVIFASSASKKGGDAKAVDYEGVVNVARACISCEVPRFVVVSSGGVSKPDSAVYKFLNLFGEIMKYKNLGEEEVRSLYRANSKPGLHYTIVRPGGLTLDASAGASEVELSQGDVLSGRIARSDVAELCLESIGSAAAADTTFECYYANTAKPLDAVGLSNIFKQTEEPAPSAGGAALRGDTWAALLSGLRRDGAASA